MDASDSSGKAFVEHWAWAADKGLMNANTAKALRATCAQILGVLDRWETVDVRPLDLDDLFRRFQNKRGKDFIPESLETYKRRFSAAHLAFLEYLDDPSSWKPPFRGRGARPYYAEKQPATVSVASAPARGEHTSAALAAVSNAKEISGQKHLIEYPFPLRNGEIAYLKLPADLQIADVKRLHAFLTSLVIDTDSKS